MQKLWYEKYRPKTWEDYVWINDDLKERIELYMENPGKTPHMCLVGSPGTGKTTLAQLLANSLVNDPNDILFVHTSMNSGVDTMRNTIDPFCQSAGWSEIKFVIMDEAERLTSDAQEALRNIHNAYGDHVRFILTCNSSTKLRGFLDSRFRLIHFEGLDRDQFMERIFTILLAEQVELDDASLGEVDKIVDTYYPDMRKTIDMLEDSCIGGKIKPAKTSMIFDGPWISDILQHIEKFDITLLRTQLSELQPEQFIILYQTLEERSLELFGETDVRDAIIHINQHHIDHSRAALPALTMAGLISTLSMLKDK